MPSTPSFIPTDMNSQNSVPMNSKLKHSYDQAKKHFQDGVNVIQGSITVIKDEFLGIYDKATSYMNKMALPVNNFLKDLSQIEAEFKAELSSNTFGPCGIIPIEEALKRPMESNY